MKLSNHFSSEEFRCRCTMCEDSVSYSPPVGLLIVLEDIRTYFDKPIKVTSAKRCITHNLAVGGSPYSKHVDGIAADIVVEQTEPSEVCAYLKEQGYAGLLGIGEYNSFTHVDVRGSKARWHVE